MSKASWSAPQAKGFKASLRLPGSKSLTNRELVLSALASSESTLLDPLYSRDSQLMIEALNQLGTRFEKSGNQLKVVPGELRGGVKIDCGLAGTVMRFIPPLAALAQGEVTFDGDAQARRRPMATTIDSLKKLGVSVFSEDNSLPFSISAKGSVQGGEVSIDASASSQFVSGLLLSGARYEKGLVIRHAGASVPSLPHINMTLACLAQRGVSAKANEHTVWQVMPGDISGAEIEIEPDLSNAGPFLAAAAITGSEISIPWPKQTTQVGDQFKKLLTQMGADVTEKDGKLVVRGTGKIHGLSADLSEAGELVPTIAAIAALADSPSELTGISHLRGHETDRIAALVNEINSIGGSAAELEDGISITPSKLHGGLWRTYEDHRMATAGAIIGLVVEGIEIQDISVTSKTMPDFSALWFEMLESN
ncbi:MAG: 3-phosphoshikimate 1-carboxyvinyltransferase [Actinomycetota bacterium]